MVIPHLLLYQMFSKCNFSRHYNVGFSTILIESLKFRNNSRITVTSSSNLLWKLWIRVLWILCFVIFLEDVMQDIAKNNPTEKQIDAEVQARLKHAPAWKYTEEKM